MAGVARDGELLPPVQLAVFQLALEGLLLQVSEAAEAT